MSSSSQHVQAQQLIHISVPKDWLPLIDQVRGDAARTEWIRQLIRRSIAYHLGSAPVQHVQPRKRPSVWSEKRRVAEDRAARHRAAQQRYLAKKPSRAARAAPELSWTFRPDGGVLCSDLSTEAGYVSPAGVYQSMSRHKVGAVVAAVRAALDAGAELDGRYRLLIRGYSE